MEKTGEPSLIEEAAAWLAALDAGTVDAPAFEDWRGADPRHAAAFAQVAATWEKLEDARRVVFFDQAESALDERPQQGVSRRFMLQAASLAAVVVAGGLGTRAMARTTAETAVGERRTVLLEDGTRLHLNTDTEVEWRLGVGGRNIWLERGEIALDVPVGAGILALHAGGLEAALAPGSYNARIQDNGLSVLVLKGRSVAFGAETAASGQKLSVVRQGAAVTASSPDERDHAIGWWHGEIVFNGEPLGTAISEYNRYLTRKLVIGDPRLGALRLGGRFTSDDPSDFVAALTASFDIVAERRPSAVILRLGSPQNNLRGG